MKTILSIASLAACLCGMPLAFAQPFEAISGSITVTTKAIVGLEGTYKENKTEQAHQLAIENNKNSTRTESYTAPVQKVGNREILQAVLETENIKGWSLVFVDTDGFEGVVAYKKGQPPVPVSEDILKFRLPEFEEESGLSSYKEVETFIAKNETFKGTYEQSYATPARCLALFDLRLSGLDKGDFKVSWSESEIAESFSFSLNGSINVFGLDEVEESFEVLVEGSISYSLKSSNDVSAYIPEFIP